MPMQKPYKHYNEGEGLCPFEPCRKGGHPVVHPPVCTFWRRGHAEKAWIFSPKVCSTYLVIFTHLDLFLGEFK